MSSDNKLYIETIHRYERYVLSLIITFLMFLFAAFSNNKEVIFPEILAIMTGAWISEKMPWNVNKRRIFILTTFAAFLGVLVVQYLKFDLFFQVMICFMGVGISLIIAKSDFIPIISACILPVYFQIKTFDYPITVAVLTSVVILFQWLMEKYNIKSKNVFTYKFDLKKSIKEWLALFVLFAIISVVPLESKNIFFIVPPLIVTFVSFANVDNKLRKQPFKVIFVLTMASVIGSILRIVINVALNLPLSICAVIAVLMLFVVFDYSRLLFPPAGAILLLPMIIGTSELKYFPLQVFVGSVILISIAMLTFRNKSKN